MHKKRSKSQSSTKGMPNLRTTVSAESTPEHHQHSLTRRESISSDEKLEEEEHYFEESVRAMWCKDGKESAHSHEHSVPSKV